MLAGEGIKSGWTWVETKIDNASEIGVHCAIPEVLSKHAYFAMVLSKYGRYHQ